jgi:hypothetical protein
MIDVAVERPFNPKTSFATAEDFHPRIFQISLGPCDLEATSADECAPALSV